MAIRCSRNWLSYRESDVLGRALTPEEVLYFAEMTRRVGGYWICVERAESRVFGANSTGTTASTTNVNEAVSDVVWDTSVWSLG